MKKKIIALLIATLLIVSLAACGTSGSTTSPSASAPAATSATPSAAPSAEPSAPASPAGPALDKSWPAETVKIGVETYDVTDAQFLAMQAYYNYLANYFNISFIYSESIANAEDEMKFVENCATAGCKALIAYYNIGQGQTVKACADKGMYYWGGGLDTATVLSALGASESHFYLGGYDGSKMDYDAGYAMAKALADQGCHKVVYVSGGDEMGIPFFIQRATGFTDGIKDAVAAGKDIQMIHKVPGWPGTDAFTAEQTAVTAMDFDGLACSFTAAVWFQPLGTAGKLNTIKIATIGSVDDTYKDLAAAGVVTCIVYDCEEVVFGGAIPMILNAVSGHENIAQNSDGTPNMYAVSRWTITTAADYQAIYDLHKAGKYFVTPEDVANLIYNFNDKVTASSFSDFYGKMDVATALAHVK